MRYLINSLGHGSRRWKPPLQESFNKRCNHPAALTLIQCIWQLMVFQPGCLAFLQAMTVSSIPPLLQGQSLAPVQKLIPIYSRQESVVPLGQNRVFEEI